MLRHAGCKNCANMCPKTFDLEDDYGRARAVRQGVVCSTRLTMRCATTMYLHVHLCTPNTVTSSHLISLFRSVRSATCHACVCVLQVLIQRRSWRLQFRAALWTAFTVSPRSPVFLQLWKPLFTVIFLVSTLVSEPSACRA